MTSLLHEEAKTATKQSKPLETLLTTLAQSDQTEIDQSAISTALVICAAVAEKPPPKRGISMPVRVTGEKQVLELQNPGNRLMTQAQGGLLLYLRLAIEIAAAVTSDPDNIHSRIKYVDDIDDVALAETLRHYRDLSIDDLWFLTYRAAVDARSSKRGFPGRYLARWRRFVTDILRTRNCEVRTQMALQEKLIPQELRIMILQKLLDLEELPPESSWEVLWSAQSKPIFHTDTAEFIPREGIEDFSLGKCRNGRVVFDPVSRQFAWALDCFGNAIYFGYEPTLLYDPQEDGWAGNPKHFAKFGALLTSID